MKRSSKIILFMTTMAITFGSLMAFVGHKRFQHTALHKEPFGQYGHHSACQDKGYFGKKGANSSETTPKDTVQ